MKMLLVDDNEIFIDTIEECLEIHKLYGLDKAYNGDEAISKIKENCLDIILLDMQMPVKDGYEVMKYLKKNKYQLPVIVTSSNPNEMKLKDIGYSNFIYLSKPFKIPALVEKIKTLTGKGFQSHTLPSQR